MGLGTARQLTKYGSVQFDQHRKDLSPRLSIHKVNNSQSNGSVSTDPATASPPLMASKEIQFYLSSSPALSASFVSQEAAMDKLTNLLVSGILMVDECRKISGPLQLTSVSTSHWCCQ